MKSRIFEQRFFQIIRSRLGLPPSLVHRCILGHEVNVRFGTIGEKIDYDEGWTYALINHSRSLFDVGCNVGTYTLLACLNNTNRRVVAIDANAQALSRVAENLFVNGFAQQVHFVLNFISNRENDEMDFYTIGTGAASSRFRSHAKTASNHDSLLKIRTTTLDRIAADLDLIPELIKIDVEGAEVEVLGGASQIAKKKQTCFIVEMHSRPEVPMEEQGEKVLSWCKSVGFDAYYLKEHKLITTSSIIAHRGRCHLFLQPKERCYPSYLAKISQGDSLEKVQVILNCSDSVSEIK